MTARKSQCPLPFEGEPTPGEKLHFECIAREISNASWHTSRGASPEAPHAIGTLREKRLHAVVKHYLCEDSATHEIPLGELLAQEDTPPTKMVADVLWDDHIYEVQTGSFYPLQKKLRWYLAHTNHCVTVVHPMAGIKYLSWIDPESGQVVSRSKVARRGRVKDVAKELYWLKEFLGDSRFSLRLLLLEIEEFRILNGYGAEKKIRAGKYERFPTALLGDVCLREAEDYEFYFLPTDLGQAPFTAAQYSQATGIRGKAAYGMLHILTELGILREGEKQGRSMTFVKKTDF